jgi:hypothetical protein
MKLVVDSQRLGTAPAIWLRSAGYTFITDRASGQDSFARRLTRDFYPRFHVYFTVAPGENGHDLVTFNLHLDQKRPGYEGYSRHNAEYEGTAVEQEVARLQSLFLPAMFV